LPIISPKHKNIEKETNITKSTPSLLDSLEDAIELAQKKKRQAVIYKHPQPNYKILPKLSIASATNIQNLKINIVTQSSNDQNKSSIPIISQSALNSGKGIISTPYKAATPDQNIREIDMGTSIFPESDTLISSVIGNNQTDHIKVYAVRTRMGKVPSKPNKVNQDSYLVSRDFMGTKGSYLFGIFDGHGTFGREASDLIKHRLPMNLALYESTSSKSGKNNFINAGPSHREEIWKRAYKKTNIEVRNSNFDASYSGSTGVVAFLYGNILSCANVGDSRAILGTVYYAETGCGESESDWKALPITIDHKPEAKNEYDRIIKSGGRVDTCRGIFHIFYNFR